MHWCTNQSRVSEDICLVNRYWPLADWITFTNSSGWWVADIKQTVLWRSFALGIEAMKNSYWADSFIWDQNVSGSSSTLMFSWKTKLYERLHKLVGLNLCSFKAQQWLTVLLFPWCHKEINNKGTLVYGIDQIVLIKNGSSMSPEYQN